MEPRDVGRVQSDVALRVAELRRRLGLTQAEFAERAHVTPHWVRRIESGTRDLKISTLQKLAHHLSVDVAELFARPTEAKAGPGRPRRAVALPAKRRRTAT